MHCKELVRFSEHLSTAKGLSVDNSLKDVKAVLELLPDPPEIVLTETKRAASTESNLLLKFKGTVVTFRCFVGPEAFSICKSSIVVDGVTHAWAWNRELDKFSFDASDDERRALHTFLTAVINAL